MSSGRGSVVIAGAGIGGLTAALCLHRQGVEVRLFETVSRLAPLGVGINLQPHAVQVLQSLGLDQDLAAMAIETSALVYLNKFGQEIWREPRGRAAGYAVPQYSLHRGELQMLLLQAAWAELPEGAVRTGCTLQGFEPAGSRVRVRFADRARGGEPVEVLADALVAADGIHSAARRQLYPDEGPPCFSGRMLWRATTEAEPFLDGRSMAWAGHDRQKFVCYPISETARRGGRALLNWIAELQLPEGSAPPRSDWNRRVDKSVFRVPFEGWNFGWLDVPGLIDRAEAVYEFPMVDRDPLPRWTHGGVTLLGDAAHPMYPVGSNGASQALLDAQALAECWSAASGPEAALQAYEASRRPATSAVVLANRQGGPDRVLQLAEERAPRGFERIEDVIPRAELEAIAAGYKRTAGFDPDTVNRRAEAQRPR